MNEQIRKLANIWANRRAEDSKLGITYTFTEKALEKFAQLIVRECCDIVHSKTDESIRVVMAIEQHFGVEE
jgi:hypothetical protein